MFPPACSHTAANGSAERKTRGGAERGVAFLSALSPRWLSALLTASLFRCTSWFWISWGGGLSHSWPGISWHWWDDWRWHLHYLTSWKNLQNSTVKAEKKIQKLSSKGWGVCRLQPCSPWTSCCIKENWVNINFDFSFLVKEQMSDDPDYLTWCIFRVCSSVHGSAVTFLQKNICNHEQNSLRSAH